MLLIDRGDVSSMVLVKCVSCLGAIGIFVERSRRLKVVVIRVRLVFLGIGDLG